MRKKLGIVIPAANEQDSIKDFCDDLIKNINKLEMDVSIFFVIDKVSKDKTQVMLESITKKNRQINVIYEAKNRNVVDAYVKGYKEALNKKCDFIIEMDCGFSHLPSELYKFVEGFNEGYDCVLGIRPLWSLSYKVPFNRRIYSLGGTMLANLLLGTKCKDMTSGFEGFTRKAAQQVIDKRLKSTGHFFQTEIRFRARKLYTKEVYINYSFPSSNVRTSSIINSFSTLFVLVTNRFRDNS